VGARPSVDARFLAWKGGRMTMLQKAALVVIGFGTGVVGVWAQVFPRSFYDDFPGMGRVWVAVDGPYNQHLVRDVGGLNLGLTFVTVVALVTANVAIGRAAGGAALIYGLPHLLYHATHLGPFDTGDAVALVTSLSFAALAAVVVLVAPAPTGTAAPPPR
jgi:hypothetical protein